MHYIYKITNRRNSKEYIGQTNDPERRWSQHKHSARPDILNESSQVVSRAMAKYGLDSFTFEVIASCKTLDDVNAVETVIIAQQGTHNPEKGYNVDLGGGAIERSPETLKKISEGLKKYYENHDGIWTGKKHSEESKAKMSEVAMGKAGTNTGKTFDDEWVINLSKSNAGVPHESKRRFSSEQEKEICRLYTEDELSMYKIAQMVNSTRGLIIDILNRNNVQRRESSYTGHSNGRNRFTPEQEQEICQDYISGKYTRVSLAEKYKCGKTTARDVLLRNGIKL